MGSVVDAVNMELNEAMAENQPKVVVILGGPGSGKGTQCAKIAQEFGYTHLSSGDILRAESKSGSEIAPMIREMIKEGKLVPPDITVKLVENAMRESNNDKFVFDGFPRDEETRMAFEDATKIEPDFVLFFDCPEDEMEKRLLTRNQAREDDNIETIRKRFKVFRECTLPVINHYESKGKVKKIDARKPVEEVFETVKPFFTPQDEKASCFAFLSRFETYFNKLWCWD